MSGLAKGGGVPLGDVILYNIFYEIFSMCTSIVAKDKEGGLIHARNLDFGLFVGWDFQNMTWPLAEALRNRFNLFRLFRFLNFWIRSFWT